MTKAPESGNTRPRRTFLGRIGARVRAFPRTGGGLALASGALFAGAFPPLAWSVLVLVAPFVLLMAVRGRSLGQGFRRGYVAGLVGEACGFYWIIVTIDARGQYLIGGAMGEGHIWGVAFGLFAAWWLLASLKWALWGALLTLRGSVPGFLVFWPAVSMTALEFFFPAIFPYHLGSAHCGWDSAAQGARWVGVHGLTTLSVLVGTLFYCTYRAFVDGKPRQAKLLGVGVGLLLFVWLGAGALRLAGADGAVTSLPVGSVQPNISLNERYAGEETVALKVFQRLIDLGTKAHESGAQLVVFPEAILPWGGSPSITRTWFDNLQFPVGLVIGVPPGPPPFHKNSAHIYTPATATTPSSMELYEKRQLLPFGERIPFRRVFELLPLDLPGDQTPGERVVVQDFEGVPVGVTICFEGILPGVAPALVEAGARLHVNITEDQWFGRTSEPAQHLALAAMRSIEADLPMVRVTNTGISSWVDRCGRIREQTELYTEAVSVFDVEVPERVNPPPITQRLPWAIAWLALPILLINVLVGRRR